MMCQHLEQLSRQIQGLHDKLPQVSAAATSDPLPVSSPLPVHRDAITPTPDYFSGELEKCKGFLLQCTLVFNRSPRSFPDDVSKISYIVGLLRDRALKWAESVIDQSTLTDYSYQEFLDLFKQTFCPKVSEESASKKLWSLKQGSRSVADFAIDFRTLATESGWNEPALKGAFLHSLNEKLKDELACRDEPDSLDELINLTIRLDHRIRERYWPSNSRPSLTASRQPPASPEPSVSPNLNQPEPMQLGRTRLSSEERHRRLTSGCCLYCGSSQHYISSCPVRPKDYARQ